MEYNISRHEIMLIAELTSMYISLYEKCKDIKQCGIAFDMVSIEDSDTKEVVNAISIRLAHKYQFSTYVAINPNDIYDICIISSEPNPETGEDTIESWQVKKEDAEIIIKLCGETGINLLIDEYKKSNK